METTGRITVKRRARPYGDLFRAYAIEIDGAHVGSIHRRKTRSFEVPPGRHRVQLRIDFCSSPPVDVYVSAGEEAHFECRAFSFNAGTAMANGWGHYIVLKLVEVLPIALGDAEASVLAPAPPAPPRAEL